MTGNTLEQRAATVPPTTAVTFVPAFSEAARMLGFAQATGSEDGVAYWGAIVAEYEAAAKAALRLPAGEGWQPIETAPKDRTDILIAGGTYSVRDYPDLKFSGVGIAFWDRNHWHGNEDNAHDEWCRHKPTHWQPLPAAPRHEAGEC